MATINDIVRYAGDTYPNKTIVKVGGVPVDLDGWALEVRYKDGVTGEIRVVDCVIADSHRGKVLIYPHSRPLNGSTIDPGMFVTDTMDAQNREASKVDPNTGTASTSNQCWTQEATYKFSMIRRRTYGSYEEIMTHNVGLVRVLDRI